MAKLIFVCALLTGCAHGDRRSVYDCARDMVELYGDLGAESSSGYESMSGSAAHYDGIKWAAEFMPGCTE